MIGACSHAGSGDPFGPLPAQQDRHGAHPRCPAASDPSADRRRRKQVCHPLGLQRVPAAMEQLGGFLIQVVDRFNEGITHPASVPHRAPPTGSPRPSSVMSELSVEVAEINRLARHFIFRTSQTIYRRELRTLITAGTDDMDGICIQPDAPVCGT